MLTIEVVGGGIPFRTAVEAGAEVAAGEVKFSFDGVLDLRGSLRFDVAPAAGLLAVKLSIDGVLADNCDS